jgi:hypothetical protein
MGFITGAMVGGFVVGMVFVMLVPPKYEDWLRGWIVTGWQKITNRG